MNQLLVLHVVPFQVSVCDSVQEAFLSWLSWYPLLLWIKKVFYFSSFSPWKQLITPSLDAAAKFQPFLCHPVCVQLAKGIPSSPAWERWVSPGHLQRSLSSSIILWVYDISFSFVSMPSGWSGTFPFVVQGMLWIFLIWLWKGWHGGSSFPLVHYSAFGNLLEWEMSKNDDSHKYTFLSNVKRENQLRKLWSVLLIFYPLMRRLCAL